jgi:hypothetical protein
LADPHPGDRIDPILQGRIGFIGERRRRQLRHPSISCGANKGLRVDPVSGNQADRLWRSIRHA